MRILMKNLILVIVLFFSFVSMCSYAGAPAPADADAAEMVNATAGNAYFSGILLILTSVMIGYVVRKVYTYRSLATSEV
jgi:hypothetical protein